jgi:hypothetical protein
MQFPGIARFGKTPNEVFPLSKFPASIKSHILVSSNSFFFVRFFLSAKAEQALDYGKELIKLVDEVIYAS